MPGSMTMMVQLVLLRAVMFTAPAAVCGILFRAEISASAGVRTISNEVVAGRLLLFLSRLPSPIEAPMLEPEARMPPETGEAT